jgi:phosphoribosylanthranilate isomerase
MIIKVCGMRDANNIKALSKLPIDYMGFIFYEKSPRYVGDILTPPINIGNIKKTGVFVKAYIDFIVEKAIQYQLNALQIHWDSPPQYFSDLKRNLEHNGLNDIAIWRAFSVDEHFNFDTTKAYEGLADVFLFDTKSPQGGGAGVKFDWSILQNYTGLTPFILAGGITEFDADVIRHISIPTLLGVDLNSRFEVEPAIKDIQKLKKFVKLLR